MEPAQVIKSKNNLFPTAVAVLLIILLCLSAYYLWTLGIVQKYLPFNTPPGFSKAQSILKDNSSFIRSERVYLSYKGILKDFNPGKYWTIEKDNKTLIIKHEGTNPVNFLKSDTNQNIEQSSLRIGDNVIINTFIDGPSGII